MPLQSEKPDQNLAKTQNSLTLQWHDLERQFVSLQNSMEARLREIDIKETQLNDRLKQLESSEREAMELRDKPSLGSISSVDGQKLSALLSQSVFEHEKLCLSVRRELESSDEPERLVLGAVGELCCENGEMGNAEKRSCVVLLEQLTGLVRPRIAPAAKAEAAKLARKWRAKIGNEPRSDVLEVLGFLLLLRAYDLVYEFDSGEVLSVLCSLGKENRHDDPASTSPVSQEKTSDRSFEEDLVLVNNVASLFTITFDALKFLCVEINDGITLKLFLYEYLGEHDWSNEVFDALSQTPNPAELVWDAMPGFLRPQLESHKTLTKARVRKSCILLLEQLMTISPSISPNLGDQALTLANEWRLKLGQIYQSPVTAYGFLLFLAAYGLTSKYEIDELLRLFEIGCQYKASLRLCPALGLPDKAEVLVPTLFQKGMLLGAVDYACAYDLVAEFPPVRLLKEYLNRSKQKIYKKADNFSLGQALDKEIAVIRTIIKYISKYGLESKYPPEDLEKKISELEKKKGGKFHRGTHVSIAGLEKKKRENFHQRTHVSTTPVSRASIAVDSQVKALKEDSQLENQASKVEPSPKEDSQLENQVAKAEPSAKGDSQLENQVAKAEPSPKEDSQLENQVAKVEPSPKEDSQLENQVAKAEPSAKGDSQLENQVAKAEPSPKGDSQLENQVAKAEPSPKEDSQLENQVEKAETLPKEDLELENQVEKARNEESSSSTRRWPLLGSLLVTASEKGWSFFSHNKPKQEMDSMASSSASPWPELKSFCVNMDGKSLRRFLYDLVDDNDDDQDLLRSAIRDALKHASDPAKLVLDVMPGCLRSQPEFDESLMLSKVRNCRILLLEELITISPQISPCVKEEALKMEIEWRDDLLRKSQTPANAYGFLYFIAAYGFASYFKVDEILSFLLLANHHKATPFLCRSLGLEVEKVKILIESLVEKNLPLEAIDHMHAFSLMDIFQAVRLLKKYLYDKRTIYVGTKPPSQNAIDVEIVAAKRVRACITKYKFESLYPPKDLEKHISELEKQKASLSDVYMGKVTSSRNAQDSSTRPSL